MSLAEDLDALMRLYDDAAQLLREERALFEAPAGSPRWSPAGHLYHAELVNRGALTAIQRIQQAGRDAAPAEKTRLGRVTLESGRFPRGRVQAPEGMVPPADFTPEALATLLLKNNARWEKLNAAQDALLALSGAFAHPLLGPLTAPDWARFAQIHTAHHHSIAREEAEQR